MLPPWGTAGCPGACTVHAAGPHLPLAELQHLGQSLSFWWREILLGLKLLLKFNGLVVGEADLPPFPFVQRPLDEGAPEQGLPCQEKQEERSLVCFLQGSLAQPGGAGSRYFGAFVPAEALGVTEAPAAPPPHAQPSLAPHELPLAETLRPFPRSQGWAWEPDPRLSGFRPRIFFQTSFFDLSPPLIFTSVEQRPVKSHSKGYGNISVNVFPVGLSRKEKRKKNCVSFCSFTAIPPSDCLAFSVQMFAHMLNRAHLTSLSGGCKHLGSGGPSTRGSNISLEMTVAESASGTTLSP